MFQYDVVKEAILDELKTSGAQAGDQLPTITELCEKYDVSRLTITRALNELELDGVIYKRRGSGSYVRGLNDDGETIDVFRDIGNRAIDGGSSIMFGIESDNPELPEEVRKLGFEGKIIRSEQTYRYKGEQLCLEVVYIMENYVDEEEAYSDGFYTQTERQDAVLFDRVSYLADGKPYRLIRRYYPKDKWKLRVNIMS